MDLFKTRIAFLLYGQWVAFLLDVDVPVALVLSFVLGFLASKIDREEA